eukprot:6855597-Heterocapsa_arctica.AAC.1
MRRVLGTASALLLIDAACSGERHLMYTCHFERECNYSALAGSQPGGMGRAGKRLRVNPAL